MDHLQTRLEALEHRTHTVERRLRWWRGLDCGLAVAGLLGWGLPLGLAREDARDKDKDQKGLAQRVAALEQLLKHFSREGKQIFITGANLHIVNGLGSTDCFDEQGDEIPDCPNGLGNLIVGYNELRGEGAENIRTGSHNVVMGSQNNFFRSGGLVVGAFNTISGDFVVVSGGLNNTASEGFAVVSGGTDNTARGFLSLVSGGSNNTASGDGASVSGGVNNTASGASSAVSGGAGITQETNFGWAAGSGGDEVVVGNFRSP
jgi:hypothetical protein